jgi:uncharacterized SAM-binding protein YcdF (DUF218 family)
MYSVIKELVLPPGSLWILLAFGFVLMIVGRRGAGLLVTAAGLTAFYLLSTPLVAGRLSALVQTVPALSDEAARNASAQAIVVLSGGLHFHSPEFGGATVDDTTLARLRYAARLHRLTGLPLLVSGGRPPGAETTLAAVMKQSLAEDFSITDVIVEDRSLDTHENAVFSAAVLAEKKMNRILLVTHASHMPRAVAAFSKTGLDIVPAPTVFAYTSGDAPTRYAPRLSGLGESHYAIYEIVGRIWYALRH